MVEAAHMPEQNAQDEQRPPLPPRPSISLLEPGASVDTSSTTQLTGQTKAQRPALQSKPTTALSSVDIQTLTFPDGTRGTFSTTNAESTNTNTTEQELVEHGLSGAKGITPNDDNDETTSLMSFAPTQKAPGDLESLLGGALGSKSPAWKLLNSHEPGELFEAVELENDDTLAGFEREFDEIAEVNEEEGNEELLLTQWKSKLKHYMILSSAGKPIWSRHGDQSLINGYIGIVQTIISFYEDSTDPLRSFSAGRTRFVVTTNGPLYFVAISRLKESDNQLRAQLDALYMQILSTLTLPTLTHLFTNRPSTDLRKPLQGTEPLLCSLADNFTKGSPSALLSALECLKIRKSHRQVINNTLLKCRSEKLLYGLIVAGGRLVSVVRPKRHSLHPSDLQLIFNMLFEAGSVKAGGGENWIPLCLPGFNNRGYLYMYVSFLSAPDPQAGPGEDAETTSTETGSKSTSSGASMSTSQKSTSFTREEDVAVLLISADKESFFELKAMRDELIDQLQNNGSIDIIKTAVANGRPATTDIVPGTPVRHFLYRSRANVQFIMPTFSPHFDTIVSRRRFTSKYKFADSAQSLLTLYAHLHTSVHAKTSHLRVIHATSRDAQALAWVTPSFELFCVAGPRAPRAALTQSANRIVQWIKREEERLFIIGGAVF